MLLVGHFICSVAGNGPAMKVGVREGDRIIEVGGKNVEKMNHAKVVELIKKKGNKVTLLVADKETYKQFQKRYINCKLSVKRNWYNQFHKNNKHSVKLKKS